MANMSETMLNVLVNNALNSFEKNNEGNITPTQQNYINAIRSGDSSKGSKLAMNLCNSMGISKNDALAQAKQFFHI